jgi:hypothetical protein
MRLSFIFLLFVSLTQAQNVIEWDGKYQLRLSDFQSATTEIGKGNIYSLFTTSNFDFAFYMSSVEFMTTKNFNGKVSCSFKRDAAAMVAPDSSIAYSLLNFARYEFDLAELYARKFRKRLFEEKRAVSSTTFIQPIYDQVQKELVERHTIAAKETEIGKNTESLSTLHTSVKREIEELADFCKTCKPPKKAKAN